MFVSIEPIKTVCVRHFFQGDVTTESNWNLRGSAKSVVYLEP